MRETPISRETKAYSLAEKISVRAFQKTWGRASRAMFLKRAKRTSDRSMSCPGSIILINVPLVKVMMEGFRIGPKHIHQACPCFIIAEAGVNHNGSLERAKQLVDIAVRAGADAVKFQTFKTENLILRNVPSVAYQKTNTHEDNQFAMIKKLELPYHAFTELKAYCDAKGIIFLSTPADRESATFLNKLVPAFKIGSGELNNHFFLRHVARLGKPMIVSTGMSTLDEVIAARDALYLAGNHGLAMLHCTTNYPTPLNEVNLRAIQTMRNALGIPIGYSDHTQSLNVSLAAVHLRACIIEKHFTYDKNAPGPDHRASLTEVELTEMIHRIRKFEKLSSDARENYIASLHEYLVILGTGEKKPTESEKHTSLGVRKTFVAVRDISAGMVLTEDMIETKRTGGDGISGCDYTKVVGRQTRHSLAADQIIGWGDLV